MRTNDINGFDLNDGQLTYSRKSVKKPLTKKVLVDTLCKYFEGDLMPVTGVDSDPIAPVRYQAPSRGRKQPNNQPPMDEMEDMPNASHITTNIKPMNPNQ